MQKAAIVTVLSLLVFSLVALPARADYLYDRSGTLVSVDGSVLGDDDSKDEVEKESKSSETVSTSPSPTAAPSRSESESKREEQKREQDKKNLERQIETRKKQNDKREVKSQLEIRSEDGKLKLKQEIKDKMGKVTNKEVELKEGESLHVENEKGERTEIKPAVMELKEQRQENRQDNREARVEERVENREQRIEMIKGKVKARTDFNLTVNEDKELIVTKPDGSSRVVTVLPDQAVAKFQEKGIIVKEGETPELTENAAGEAVYKVTQEEERRILGFAIKFKRENEVSAETGEVQTKSGETNPVKRWLERFVF